MNKTSIALLALLTLGGISAEAATLESSLPAVDTYDASVPVTVSYKWIDEFKDYSQFMHGIGEKFPGVPVNDIDSVTARFVYTDRYGMPIPMTLVIKDTPSLQTAQNTLQEYLPRECVLTIQRKAR